MNHFLTVVLQRYALIEGRAPRAEFNYFFSVPIFVGIGRPFCGTTAFAGVGHSNIFINHRVTRFVHPRSHRIGTPLARCEQKRLVAPCMVHPVN